jgi:hypothetical protein
MLPLTIVWRSALLSFLIISLAAHRASAGALAPVFVLKRSSASASLVVSEDPDPLDYGWWATGTPDSRLRS